jgi:Rrf2 family protein
VRVSAKVDYAVRAAVELAAAADGGRPMKAEHIARAQEIPLKFLENILQGLRNAQIVESRRGPEGGHLLARPAGEVSVADIIRAIDGPLGSVGSRPPEDIEFTGHAAPMRDVWVAARAGLRSVLEHVTLDDIVRNELPEAVDELIHAPGAWERRRV